MTMHAFVSGTFRGFRWVLAAALVCGGASSLAASPPSAAKAQYTADTKKAATRYSEDKKLCADESSNDARLQCRRDAKAAYDKAMVEAKNTMTAAGKSASAKSGCPECGTVVAVSQSEREGEGSALGMIAGGVGGALLGNQVGSGTGKDIATVVGAVGGAYAGKKIEEKVRAYKVWTVSVEYADHSRKNFEFKQDPGFGVGDAVKNTGETIARR